MCEMVKIKIVSRNAYKTFPDKNFQAKRFPKKFIHINCLTKKLFQQKTHPYTNLPGETFSYNVKIFLINVFLQSKYKVHENVSLQNISLNNVSTQKCFPTKRFPTIFSQQYVFLKNVFLKNFP